MRSCRSRRRRALASAVAVLAVAATAVADVDLGSAHAVPSAGINQSWYVRVPDTAYTFPTNAIVVSPLGDDHNAGTLAAPFATIGHALAVAPRSATVVLRGGTYREPTLSVNRPVTIQPYPHEIAWLKGSIVMTGFTPGAIGTWVHPWQSPLCGTCTPTSALDPAYPAAGLPDEVFVDGAPLQQVTTASAVTHGTFFVDRLHRQLVLGNDPTGHTIEVTAQAEAMQITPSGAGTVVRGVGIEHYGPTYGYAVPAMVVVTASNVTFDHDALAWSATRGISVLYSHNDVITDSVLLHNGLNGIHAHHADGLQVIRTRIADSNHEHFSTAPTAYAAIAAIKVTSTFDAVVRDSLIDDNDCNGIWFDLSAFNTTISGNDVLRNSGQGIFYEVSGNGTIAGNVVAYNGHDGVRLSGSTNVNVWHNTLVDNSGAQLGVYEDARTQPNPYLRSLGITWDAANASVADNVLASSSATLPLLMSWDPTGKRTTAMMMGYDDHNLWARASVASTPYDAQWQAASSHILRLPSVQAMRVAIGRERTGVVADNVPLTQLFLSPTALSFGPVYGSPLFTAGLPLPASVAAALGVPAGSVIHLGAQQVPPLG
jgi:parallel beta-helix repeat protein